MGGQGRIRSTRQILATMGMVSALLFGAAAPVAAQDVVIRPIESDLASKPWVSVTASSGAATANNATDGDADSAWVATKKSPGQWLQLDLGGGYDNIRKVEVVFPDARALYTYVIEASSDGDRLGADREGPRSSGRAAAGSTCFTRPDTAYLRVTITAASHGRPSASVRSPPTTTCGTR